MRLCRLAWVVPDDVDIVRQWRRRTLVQMIPDTASHKSRSNPAIGQIKFPDKTKDMHTLTIGCNHCLQLLKQRHIYSSWTCSCISNERCDVILAGQRLPIKEKWLHHAPIKTRHTEAIWRLNAQRHRNSCAVVRRKNRISLFFVRR